LDKSTLFLALQRLRQEPIHHQIPYFDVVLGKNKHDNEFCDNTIIAYACILLP
jgi:hypothetical protein